jgi:hypothetical protein
MYEKLTTQELNQLKTNIMKTPMQELFSKLEIEHPNLFNVYSQEGRDFINGYIKFIELEKENIIFSYNKGCIDGLKNETKLGKEFYQEEFKNK